MRADIGGNGANREAAIVTKNDIARMRMASKVTSDADQANNKKILEEQKA